MDYPENLSEKDPYWLNIIQECRASGKSDYQWLQENTEILFNMPMGERIVVNDRKPSGLDMVPALPTESWSPKES